MCIYIYTYIYKYSYMVSFCVNTCKLTCTECPGVEPRRGAIRRGLRVRGCRQDPGGSSLSSQKVGGKPENFWRCCGSTPPKWCFHQQKCWFCSFLF